MMSDVDVHVTLIGPFQLNGAISPPKRALKVGLSVGTP
jgi:hypothetical protein